MTAVRPRLRALGFSAAIGLAASPLTAASYVRVTDEALVDQASVAVVVRIEATDRKAGARRGGRLFTEVAARVEEALKGRPAGEVLRLYVPGGEGPDGVSLEISGAPRFRPGERALLFLEPHGGAYRPLHLFLGVFHEIEAEGNRLAVRDLAGASEIRVSLEGALEAPPPLPDPPRVFAAFARWIADRAAGRARPADYLADDATGALARTMAKFTLLLHQRDRRPLRWFDFDRRGAVEWRASERAQEGIPGGGYAELQVALRAWNDEPQTLVAYRYAGTTAAAAGLDGYDGINSVLFNDPNDSVTPFSCATGGMLAVAGPYSEEAISRRDGKPFHRIVEADVVVNDGISCLFVRSVDPLRLAEELFAHELGHTLGLGHSCGDNVTPACTTGSGLDQALMRAFIHDDGRGARLEADDLAGLRALYAAGAPPAAPSRLTATVLSPVEVELSWKDRARDETEYRVEVRTVNGVFEDVGAVPADSTAAIVQGLTPATGYLFRVRAGREGIFSAYSNEARIATDAVPGPCVSDAHTLCLRGGRFQVRVAWALAGGGSGLGSATPLPTGGSGLFWFFGPDNLELLVKVLDGCADNDRYWVFTGPATTLQYVLTVNDTRTGKVRVYFHPQGLASPALSDTEAFACP